MALENGDFDPKFTLGQSTVKSQKVPQWAEKEVPRVQIPGQWERHETTSNLSEIVWGFRAYIGWCPKDLRFREKIEQLKTFKLAIFSVQYFSNNFFAFYRRISLKRYLNSAQRARSNEPLFAKIGQSDQKLAKSNIFKCLKCCKSVFFK